MDNEEKRDAAKQLFIILGYGGGVDSWCKQHGVAKEKLPNFVTDFAREQRTLRKEDVLQRPDMHAMARRRGHHRPDVKVQATLNLEGEREALDAMEAGLGNIDTCELGSYEHDGLFVWLPPWAEASAGWQYIVRSRQRGGRARGGSIYFAEGEAGVAQGAGWQYIVRARGLRHREPQEQNFDSGGGFKGKVESQDPTSRDCEFWSSTRTKIMNFQDFNFAWCSLLILKSSSSLSTILEVSWSKIIEKQIDVCKKCLPQDRPQFDGLEVDLLPIRQRSKKLYLSCVCLMILVFQEQNFDSGGGFERQS